ncbi:MAG: DUF4136 domain-containing protein [Burkholderiaceae bacterium]|nr:DUF4136 domain-containing protein [Burkholderiaceae bacterium]MCD6671410.1 DUF4136 domain-containing protein [Burkholderiaceae bacterium]
MVAFRRCLLLALLATLSALAGCATPLRGEVTTFNAWPADAPRTYRFVRTEPQRNSLEHAQWEDLLRFELARAGFRQSPDPRFAVSFDYRVDRRMGSVVEYQPVVQPYFWWGAFGPHAGFSLGGPFPWWGSSYYPVASDRIWYDYRLHLQIEDLSAKPPRRVYEGTAISDGYIPQPEEVLPLLARALLEDFPGPSGVTRRVEVPRERK